MTHSFYKTFSKLRMSCIVTFLCLHNFYFAAKNIEVRHFSTSYCSHSYTVQLAKWNARAYVLTKRPRCSNLDFLEIEVRTGETSGCHQCSCAVGGGQCRSLCHSPSSLLLCRQSASQVSNFDLVCLWYFPMVWIDLNSAGGTLPRNSKMSFRQNLS